MSDTDAKRELITDQAGREASGGHKYGRYLEEFELGDYASNLVGGDTNADTDAFVNDRGATQRVSVSSAGHQGNASSFAGSIATGCGAAGQDAVSHGSYASVSRSRATARQVQQPRRGDADETRETAERRGGYIRGRYRNAVESRAARDR